MSWGIYFSSYRFQPVEIVRETPKCVFYIDRDWGASRETRCDKGRILDFRGSKDEAKKLSEHLTSARAEMERRKQAASTWFSAEKVKLIERAKARGESND